MDACLRCEFGSFGEAQVAFRECQGQKLLDFGFLAIARHGHFADQKVAGAFEHFLFAEGEWFCLVQGDQAFKHSGNFEQGTGAHAIGIFLEAVFPVGGAQALGHRKKVQNLLDFAIAHDPADTHAAYIAAWNHYLQAAGFNVEQVELFHGSADRPAADLLDNPDSMVWINDFIADVEIQICNTHKGTQEGEVETGKSLVTTIYRVSRIGTKSKVGSDLKLDRKSSPQILAVDSGVGSSDKMLKLNYLQTDLVGKTYGTT
jgi:hypothetical protein